MRDYIFLGEDNFGFKNGKKYKMDMGRMGIGYTMRLKPGKGFFSYSTMESLLKYWEPCQKQIKL